MKFDYQFRTRDNELKSGTIAASSRDAAFAALKRQGVNPSRVVLSPGFLNRLAAIGKRGWLIVILALALLAAVLSLLRRPPAPSVPRGGDIDPEVLKRLEASGLDVVAINELLSQRRKINEEYRRKIEAEVERGILTRKAANEMLQAAGLEKEGEPQ